MAEISVKIINDKSAEVIAAMKSQVLLGLKAIGTEAERYAKSECPVDTGLLRNSITWALAGEAPATKSYKADTGTKSGSYNGALPASETPTVYIGTNVEYAPEVEFVDRSHKTGKAHFLRDSVTTHGDRYKAIMDAALRA